MKNPFKCLSLLSFVFALYILPAAALAQTQPQKLSKEELDEAAVDYAEEMADQILSSMAEGGYYEFTEEEATPQVTQAFTEDAQKQTYAQIKEQVGDYQSSLEYKETYQLKQGGEELRIFRFRGEFAEEQPEVRVVFTPDNKLAGLLVVPWSDQLQ